VVGGVEDLAQRGRDQAALSGVVRRSYVRLDEFAIGYGLQAAEVEAALDGVELDEGYFAGSRTADELQAARLASPTPEVEQRPTNPGSTDRVGGFRPAQIEE